MGKAADGVKLQAVPPGNKPFHEFHHASPTHFSRGQESRAILRNHIISITATKIAAPGKTASHQAKVLLRARLRDRSQVTVSQSRR